MYLLMHWLIRLNNRYIIIDILFIFPICPPENGGWIQQSTQIIQILFIYFYKKVFNGGWWKLGLSGTIEPS